MSEAAASHFFATTPALFAFHEEEQRNYEFRVYADAERRTEFFLDYYHYSLI
jgi:hypothetical protein